MRVFKILTISLCICFAITLVFAWTFYSTISGEVLRVANLHFTAKLLENAHENGEITLHSNSSFRALSYEELQDVDEVLSGVDRDVKSESRESSSISFILNNNNVRGIGIFNFGICNGDIDALKSIFAQLEIPYFVHGDELVFIYDLKN